MGKDLHLACRVVPSRPRLWVSSWMVKPLVMRLPIPPPQDAPSVQSSGLRFLHLSLITVNADSFSIHPVKYHGAAVISFPLPRLPPARPPTHPEWVPRWSPPPTPFSPLALEPPYRWMVSPAAILQTPKRMSLVLQALRLPEILDKTAVALLRCQGI